MTEILNFLLDNSHRIPSCMIVDCLKLARLNPSPDDRVSPALLCQRLGTKSAAEACRRMVRLQRSGLIDYEGGKPFRPGYRILRVGPKP